jgi:hypothetical protein
MAIVVLVLWMCTAGAGFYLLVTSNLGRARPATPVIPVPGPQPVPASTGQSASRRELRKAKRDRWDPPSLTAAKQAPVIPGARSLLEFAHPACAIIGLGFWLGFTLIHNKALGWIAFGLIAVTACLGVTGFTANTRAVRPGAAGRPAPHFSGRLMALHGAAAAVTVTLAALTALLARG